jgi:biopolymer transport protein ExbD
LKIKIMAEMNIPDGNGHSTKVRMKKAPLRIDLTPMVDLAFLLITFFMLTTTLLKQKAMEMNDPKRNVPPQSVSECQVLNLLTDSLGQMYYWEGLECKTVSRIALTGGHSLKDKIKEKKNYLLSHCLYVSGKPKSLVCLIKLLPGIQYGHMVRVLDEVVTDSVPVYAIQAYSDDEIKAVRDEKQKLAM